MRGKRGKWGAVVLAMALVCGGWSAAGAQVLRLGNSYPADHPSNVGVKKMNEVLAAKTQGKLSIELFPNGQLGSDEDVVQGTIMGTQDMLLIGIGGLAHFSPTLGIGECPYIWRDIDHMMRTFDGPVGDDLRADMLKNRGLRILTTAYYGRRHLTANKPIMRPEEMKGFKLRTPQVVPILEMAKAWGTSPMPMPIAELYLALKANVVDGQENPLPTIDTFKFYEAQKYLMLTGHILDPLPILINERVWRGLSPEYQKIIMEGAYAWREVNNKLMLEQEQTLLDKFKKAGMTVVQPDVDAFKKASLGVREKLENVWGKGLYEKIVNVR